jgi:hypothetical protein
MVMHTLNINAASVDECRRLNWAPFRTAFFLRCKECSVATEFFTEQLDGKLQLIAEGKPANWPYEIKGNLRTWYENISREEALKICKANSDHRFLATIGSKHSCIE